MYEGRTFFIQAAPVMYSRAPIVAAEYFIDNDPGIGQATSVPVTAVYTRDRIIDAATAGVDTGLHYAYMRVKDAAGQWSMYARDTFTPKLDLNDVAQKAFFSKDFKNGFVYIVCCSQIIPISI